MGQETKEKNSARGDNLVASDDIDVVGLLITIWRYRYIGILIGLVPVVFAIVYAVTAGEVYRSEIAVHMPQSKSVNELNVKVSGGTNYTPSMVYSDFVNNLYSYAIRREFYGSHKLHEYYGGDLSAEKSFKTNFDMNLVVSEPEKKENQLFTKVSFEIDNAEKAASLLGAFVNKVSEYTINELIDNVKNSVDKRIEVLLEEITSKRKMAQKRREDRILILEEALVVAKSLGINTPSDFNRMTKNENSPEVSVNTDSMPRYALGTKALSAEIEALKNRKSDDPYISGLRDLQEELAYLDGIHIDPKKIDVMRVDHPAMVPEQRIKPNRKLIVIIGGLAGGMAAIVGIFVIHFLLLLKSEVRQMDK